MLKKIFTLGMLVGLAAVSTNSIAQEKQEYPRYGFWSNWSIGLSIDGVKQGGTNSWDWARGTNAGATLMLEKELNHVWALRLSAAMPGMWTTAKEQDDSFDRYAMALASFKFSINNACMGYNPDTKWSIYLMAGAGFNYGRIESTQLVDYEGNVAGIAAVTGLGYSHKVSDHSTLFLELITDVNNTLPNIFKGSWHTDTYLSLGYLCNLGITEADRVRMEQVSMLTKDNFDALNAENDNLKADLKNAQDKVNKLQTRVNGLESDLAKASAPSQADNAANKKLQAAIDQIKADQLNYYALPFSVLFGIDKYNVTSAEMRKVEAIAAVIKAAPAGTKFNVIGFCDVTGSDDYNMKLSVKRANEVKRLLVEKYGVNADQLVVDGKGKTIAFGDASYAVNRRVSFYRVIE